MVHSPTYWLEDIDLTSLMTMFTNFASLHPDNEYRQHIAEKEFPSQKELDKAIMDIVTKYKQCLIVSMLKLLPGKPDLNQLLLDYCNDIVPIIVYHWTRGIVCNPQSGDMEFTANLSRYTYDEGYRYDFVTDEKVNEYCAENRPVHVFIIENATRPELYGPIDYKTSNCFLLGYVVTQEEQDQYQKICETLGKQIEAIMDGMFDEHGELILQDRDEVMELDSDQESLKHSEQ
jgi:hypothetical protein